MILFVFNFAFVLGGLGCRWRNHASIDEEHNFMYFGEKFECPTFLILTSKEAWLLSPIEKQNPLCQFIQREQNFTAEGEVMKRSLAFFPQVSTVDYSFIPGESFRIGGVYCDQVYVPLRLNFTLGYDSNTHLDFQKGKKLLI